MQPFVAGATKGCMVNAKRSETGVLKGKATCKIAEVARVHGMNIMKRLVHLGEELGVKFGFAMEPVLDPPARRVPRAKGAWPASLAVARQKVAEELEWVQDQRRSVQAELEKVKAEL